MDNDICTFLSILLFIFGTIYGIIFIVVSICVVQIAIAVWVYRDAKKHGEDALLWLLIVLLTGIIGLLVYLFVREDKGYSYVR